MPLILLGDAAQLHDPSPAHPDSRERIERLCEEVTRAGFPIQQVSRRATLDELDLVHAPAYVRSILSMEGLSGRLDAETEVGPHTVDAALNAVGTALAMADLLRDRQASEVFSLVRPPGHHASSDRGMGYCIFNNIAVAAEYLTRQGSRVCILDCDVHHGNGTEQIFCERADVLYISIHSDGLFPTHTGAVDAVGCGAGEGANINIPLPPGCALPGYAMALGAIVEPAIHRFRPDYLLVSFGFDTHWRDPHGAMSLTTDDFEFLGTALRQLSASTPLGLLLEGGYDVDVIGKCAVSLLSGMQREPTGFQPVGQPSALEIEAIEHVARIHGLPAYSTQR